MTIKNITIGLLCLSIVSAGLFFTACKPADESAGTMIQVSGAVPEAEGPGDTSEMERCNDVTLSVQAKAPDAGTAGPSYQNF